MQKVPQDQIRRPSARRRRVSAILDSDTYQSLEYLAEYWDCPVSVAVTRLLKRSLLGPQVPGGLEDPLNALPGYESGKN